MKWLTSTCVVLALTLLWGLGEATAQQTAVSGQVVDVTGRPIVGASIILTGGTTTARTDQNGKFTLPGIAPGPVTLRAAMIGYQSVVRTLTVGAGQTTTVDFQLPTAVVRLDEIVVTATGAQRKLELGHVVARVDVAPLLEAAPIKSMTDLLSARTAGVLVTQSSGTSGAGTRVRIRGNNSISLSNDPIVIVDGIRVESSVGLTVGTGGQSPSRLNDINPEDIESYEIVKGPSAATLYGTDAGNGVIRITTKRGKAGAPRWDVHTESGSSEQYVKWPDNYKGVGQSATVSLRTNCRLPNVIAGQCTQDSVVRFQPLSDPATTPFSTGSRGQYGVSVSGGSDAVQYYLAGEMEKETGPYRIPQRAQDSLVVLKGAALPDYQVHPNDLNRVNMRANLRSQVLTNADVTASVGYLSSDLHLPQNDNNVLGLLPSGYFGGLKTVNDGWGFFRPEEIYAIEVLQSVERFTGSTQANWYPAKWLNMRGTVGLDATTRADIQYQPANEGPNFGTRRQGQRDANTRRIYNYTGDFSVSGIFDLTSLLQSKTSVGIQYFRELTTGTNAFGEQLGARSVSAAAVTRAGETTAEARTLGTFVEQQLSFRDRMFLTGALRGDDNSAFGSDFDYIVYPKVSLSWVLSKEAFFPRTNVLSSVRLRSGWGSSGVRPGTTDAVRFFAAAAATDGAVSVTGVTYGGAGGNLGNPRLKPEKSTELEVGADFSLLSDRMGLEVTHYQKKTKDALIERQLAPSLGVSATRWENLGSIQNKGWEATLNAHVVDTRPVKVDLGVVGSTNENKVLDIGLDNRGQPLPPILLGDQRHVVGYPAGSFWARALRSYSDANGDGIVALSEIVIDTGFSYLGTPFPKTQAGITTNITIFNRIKLYALLDYRGGHKQLNLTEVFRCNNTGNNCRGIVDRTSSPFEQARALAASAAAPVTNGPFIEDATFTKLREVSLTFAAPNSWARMFRVDRLSLTLTGQNLKTWTNYTGVDPEVQETTNSLFGTRDFLTQPPVRTWLARVNLSF